MHIRFANLTLLSCLLVFAIGTTGLGADGNWPAFRGADGSGHTADVNLAVRWKAEDVVWRTELEGQGQSSPCIWENKIFLTAAAANGNKVDRLVYCIERGSGEVLWKKVAASGGGEDLHKMNSWATPTCTTDGQCVVAYFGRGGIHCYDMDGQLKWSQDLGSFPGPWGTGASPIILGDMVVQNCDAEGPSYLIALDKDSGKTVWRTERKALPRGGWSTPLLIDTGQRKELVLNGEFGVQGYDPATGSDYWYCKSFNGRGTPVPAWGHGLLFVVNGKPGDIYAVRPGGSGDVTATHMAWHTPRKGGRDLPSPILVGDYLLVVNMGGIASMYHARTGEELWKERIGGNFSASPIAANGLIYIQDESGETIVIRPGKKLELVSTNPVGAGAGEIFRSSPAPSDGQLFLRSNRALYCIGKRIEAKS